MKTKILTTVILLFTVVFFAKSQTSEHMTFKGVPIDGTLAEFVSKMKQNGFTYLETKDETAWLKGDFAGYKECFIAIPTFKQKDLVFKVTVVFHECETWSSLSEIYFDLKEMLAEKYGKPYKVVEEFNSYSQPLNDNSKYSYVTLDLCKYSSIFQADKGDIWLSIEKGGFVQLSYFDKINKEIIQTKAKSDL